MWGSAPRRSGPRIVGTMMEAERDIVWGLFTDRAAATAALETLIDRHFDPREDLSVVLARGPDDEPEVHHVDDELEYVEGAKIGGGIGAALGAMGAGLMVAGLVAAPSALIAAGPIAGVLQGALAGGAFGTFSGWLVGSGIVSPETSLDDADLEGGAVWVAVHALGEREDEALTILREEGAERVGIR